MRKNEAFFAGLFALSCIGTSVADATFPTSSPSSEQAPIESLVTFGTLPSGSDTKNNAQPRIRVGKSLANDELMRTLEKNKDASLVFLDMASIIDDESSIEKVKSIFRSGVPILLKADDHSPELTSKMSEVFGISGPFRYALFQRVKNARVEIYRLEDYSEKNILNAAQQVTRGRQKRASPPNEEFVGLPKLTYNINIKSPTQEMTSVVNIDIIRSAQRTQDKKFVIVTTNPTTINSAKNGITIGGFGPGGSGNNLWGAYLPHAYRFTQQLTAQSVTPNLVSFEPKSDARTDFEFSKTEKRGFAIGGSIGSEFGGATQDEKINYAAKSPFNVNFGLSYENSKTISFTFKDYSLLASHQNSKVTWSAPIHSELKGVLIDRVTAGLPVLTEKGMTPMMRSASLESYTLWELPGDYTGHATVKVGGGYDLARDEWWWDRSRLKERHVTDVYNAEEDYVLDMSSPFLTREMTVLIRSAQGSGKCLTGNTAGAVSLESCVATNSKQQWGLDSESRYVNRATQSCLTLRESDGALLTTPCAIDNRQQWEWQADRIHSMYNREWRLYLTNDRLKIIPDGSMPFQILPKNIFNELNIPWASYPLAPSKQDVMPNHNGPSPQISPDWVDKYQGVDVRQRWRIEVLRDGI